MAGECRRGTDAEQGWCMAGYRPHLPDGRGRQGVVLKVRKPGRPAWPQLPNEHLTQPGSLTPLPCK